jgi:hypothetical protein
MATSGARPERDGQHGHWTPVAASLGLARALTRVIAEPPPAAPRRAVAERWSADPGPEEVAVCELCGLVSRRPVPPACPACGGGYG